MGRSCGQDSMSVTMIEISLNLFHLLLTTFAYLTVLLKACRSISFLSTLSKILEKTMEQKLRVHLNKFNLLPSIQSELKASFSGATAMSVVHDDIFRALDNGSVAGLVLLDVRQ